MNRRLTELVREVPIDDDPATDFPAMPYDREAVHRIFDDLQFRVLRERLLETFVQEDETSTEGFEVAGARLEPGTVRGWLAAHASGRVGLVVRGTWAPGGGDVHTLALAAADGAAAVIDVVAADPDDEAALTAWFADPDPDEGRARSENGHQCAHRPRLGGGRGGLRHRTGGLSRPAGSGDLRPQRPGPAVPAPHA